MKKCIKALILWLSLSFLILNAAPAILASEKEPPVLKVAFPEADGINEVYEDGTYGGSVYDWLQEISKYTGWTYEFVTGDPSELVEGMERGAYDLMGGVYLLEGLDELYSFPKYIMGSNYSLLIYRQSNPDIKSYDHSTLNGKRIGVSKKAVSRIHRLKKFLSLNSIQCELVYYENTEDYENCLETDEVDLMLGSDIQMQNQYNVAAQFEADPYYLVTAKNKPQLCEQLSAAMESIYAANPNFATELYNRYFPNRYINSIIFTEEEEAFKQQIGSIKVAVMKDRYPLFYKIEGTVRGIVPDCLKLISQRTGLTFEYVYADTYQDLIDLVQQKKADIIGAFQNGDISAKERRLVKTIPYASLDSVVLHNKQSLDTSKELTMAIPVGTEPITSSSNDTVCYYHTYQECMDAVNSGEADYTRMPAAYIEEFYSKDYYANISLVADTNLQEELSIALGMPVTVPLYSILSKALNSFSAEESAHILSNNSLALHKTTVTFKTLLYTQPVVVIGICVSIILLISIIIILLNFNRMRARVMKLRLEKAEEMSRSKSDFLSRMSHEIRTPMNAIIGLTNLTRMTSEVTPAVDDALSKIDSSAQFLLSLLNDILDMSKIEQQKMKLENAPFNLEEMISQIEGMFSVQAKSLGLSLEILCNLKHSSFVGDKLRLQQVLTNLLSNACKFTDSGGSVRLTIIEQPYDEKASVLCFRVLDTGIGIQQEDMDLIFRAFEQARDSSRHAPGTGLGLAISSSLVELMGGELKVKSRPSIGSEFYFTVSLLLCDEVPSREVLRKNQPEARLEGLCILLAEDNLINAEIVTELLKTKKATVDWAADGQQAVDLFAKSPEGAYSAILMDINMPVMDGLTATKQIRSMDRSDARTIPILAMTANTFQEDRDNAAEAGMTGFLPKPFDVEQLYNILLNSMEA